MVYLLIGVVLLLPGCLRFGPSATNAVVQGSGVARQEQRSVHEFDKIKVTGVGTVIFKQADTYELIVEADDSALAHIVSTVENHALHIHIKGYDHVPSQTPITYYVTAPNIKDIILVGSAGFQTQLLRSDYINMDLTGASEVSGRFMVHTLKVDASGSSNLLLQGESETQTVKLVGASVYDAQHLKSNKVTIDVMGASQGIVHAIKDLHATVSGTANLVYTGEPCLTIRQSGMATINNVR